MIDRKKEIQEQISILEKEYRELLNQYNVDLIPERKKEFETIKGKVFKTAHKYQETRDEITVKVIDCTDWGPYNCCNVIKLTVTYKNNKYYNFNITKDTLRVSVMANGSVTEVSETELDLLKEFLIKESIKSLSRITSL
jgi:hypothetical protein